MNENLNKWACSFAGCDGGNPNADIWLCGVEWGYESATAKERENYYKNELPIEIKKGEHKLNRNYNFFTDESMSFRFNLALAKLYSLIRGGNFSSFKENAEEILKLNLSPISFNKDDESLWSDNLIKVTGYRTKAAFLEFLNSLNRFSAITREYKPKLIICVGNGRKDNFVRGFFGDDKIQPEREAIKPDGSNKNQNNRYIYYAKNDETLLVVTPFSTSSNGLNSDFLLKKAGEKIRGLLNDSA